MSLKITLLVIAAGSVGTLLRYLIVRSFPLSMLPWSTFTVNVTGSFLAGLLFVLMKQRFPAFRGACCRYLLFDTSKCRSMSFKSAFRIIGKLRLSAAGRSFTKCAEWSRTQLQDGSDCRRHLGLCRSIFSRNRSIRRTLRRRIRYACVMDILFAGADYSSHDIEAP